MKNIIKLTCLLLTVCGFAGCTGNFDEYNTDPYALYKGDPAVLIPTMLDAMMYVQQNDSQMVDQMVGSLGGYFTLSNRWGGQNFDTFNASDAWNATPYNTMFEDIYANFFDIEKSTSKSGHYYAMARLVRAAVMMRVADCYGPIPYSKVADGSFYVEYDSAEDVYKHIIKSRIGHADYDIRLNGMLKREKCARTASRLMNAAPVYHRIGTREIHVLKYADALRRGVAEVGYMLYPVLAENDYLAGANIRLKGRADRVERAGLRCDNIASVGQSAVAERAEAVSIARRDELCR